MYLCLTMETNIISSNKELKSRYLEKFPIDIFQTEGKVTLEKGFLKVTQARSDNFKMKWNELWDGEPWTDTSLIPHVVCRQRNWETKHQLHTLTSGGHQASCGPLQKNHDIITSEKERASNGLLWDTK